MNTFQIQVIWKKEVATWICFPAVSHLAPDKAPAKCPLPLTHTSQVLMQSLYTHLKTWIILKLLAMLRISHFIKTTKFYSAWVNWYRGKVVSEAKDRSLTLVTLGRASSQYRQWPNSQNERNLLYQDILTVTLTVELVTGSYRSEIWEEIGGKAESHIHCENGVSHPPWNTHFPKHTPD